MAGKVLQIEEGDGIRDDAARGMRRRLKAILRAAAKEEFVGIDLQALVEDGLASDEPFVHAEIP